MAVELYDVTASEVLSKHLAGIANANTTAMEAAIKRAASKANVELRAAEITPSLITEADYPDDYETVRNIVMAGAAAYYLESVAGSSAAVAARMGEFQDSIMTLRNRPNVLSIHNPKDGKNIPISHLTKASTDDKARLTARLPNPARRRQFETL